MNTQLLHVSNIFKPCYQQRLGLEQVYAWHADRVFR